MKSIKRVVGRRKTRFKPKAPDFIPESPEIERPVTPELYNVPSADPTTPDNSTSGESFDSPRRAGLLNLKTSRTAPNDILSDNDEDLYATYRGRQRKMKYFVGNPKTDLVFPEANVIYKPYAQLPEWFDEQVRAS